MDLGDVEDDDDRIGTFQLPGAADAPSVPVSIYSVQFLELDPAFNVLNQDSKYVRGVDFASGDRFSYDSVTASQDDAVPGGMNMVLRGLDAAGRPVRNVFTITYTNECGVPTFHEGEAIGWVLLVSGAGSAPQCSTVHPRLFARGLAHASVLALACALSLSLRLKESFEAAPASTCNRPTFAPIVLTPFPTLLPGGTGAPTTSSTAGRPTPGRPTTGRPTRKPTTGRPTRKPVPGRGPATMRPTRKPVTTPPNMSMDTAKSFLRYDEPTSRQHSKQKGSKGAKSTDGKSAKKGNSYASRKSVDGSDGYDAFMSLPASDAGESLDGHSSGRTLAKRSSRRLERRGEDHHRVRGLRTAQQRDGQRRRPQDLDAIFFSDALFPQVFDEIELDEREVDMREHEGGHGRRRHLK